jgi:hypothetical protein
MRFVPSSTLLIARLAYASRSWCTTFVGCNMRDLRPGDAHATKSGGRQPAVGRRTERCAANITHCSRDHATHKQERRASARRGNETHTQRRPAFADGSRFVPQIRLPAPRLAHASRSYLKTRMLLVICVSYLRVRYSLHGWLTPAAPGCATCVRRKIRHLRCTSAHPTKSGGRQPAVGRQNRIRIHARYSSADRRRCVCGLPLHSRLSAPRGANAPRSCGGTRISAGEKTIFTLHIRTPDQERRASARRGNETHSRQRLAFADGSRFVPQIRLPAPRLAHASRSCLKTRMLLVICVSYLRVRYSLHGWLTPAAPGCATCVRRKIRHLCSHAHPTKSGGRQPAVATKRTATAAVMARERFSRR